MSFDQSAQTDDIDIASFERLSLALDEQVSTSVQDLLADFKFAPVTSLDPKHVWRWRQSVNETLVEFLTPSFEENEGIKHLQALGVDAQSLHHLNFVLATPEKAALPYRDGVLIQVPRPERFAIHKLVIADRRADRLKARKDRAQAAFVIEVLAQDRPQDLMETYREALASGQRWKERIERSLSQMPDTQEILDGLDF